MRHLIRHALLACALGAAAPAWAAKESPITTEAMQAFWWGDFAALDKQNALLRQPGHIGADGSSDLEMFRFGINQVISQAGGSEAYLQELEKLTRQWTEQYPKSALAHVLYALVLTEHGWAYRGGGLGRDVPQQAWEDFRGYLQRAAEHLIKHADVALTDSYAHAALLVIGRGLSWDRQQMATIEQDGIKRNPEDIMLYFDMIHSLTPKWGGDASTLDRYIRQVTEQTKATYGTGMYARLYAVAADDEYGHRLFEDSKADWPTVKRSYQDMLARSPSVGRTNRYAYMACLAQDKETLATLLNELGDNVDASLWGSNPRTVEACKRLINKT